MIDVLILNTSDQFALDKCINSIDDMLPVNIKVVNLSENPTLQDIPGSIYNKILHDCINPLFTIIDSNDYFLPGSLQALLEFVRHKSFGLLYAASIKRTTSQPDPVTDLPLLEETIYSVNPMRSPIFYNRKIVEYLLRFDHNTYYPEFDMCLKIWQRFEVTYFPTPLTNKAHKNLYNPEYLHDLETLIYNSKVRGTKQFFYAYASMYPDGLLDPVLK